MDKHKLADELRAEQLKSSVASESKGLSYRSELLSLSF
jgi:hypothetical protein